MLFRETVNTDLPTIILLHGGGLSWWSFQDIIEKLQSDFHIVTPIIDGHAEDNEEFISIEDSAEKLIKFIDKDYDGKVYAIGGLSIGGQIVTEVLARCDNICEYAIIESALVYPIKGTAAITLPMTKLCYRLVKKRWFSKMQAKTLCVPPKMFEQYYQDSLKISKQSLINITLSNGNYNLKRRIPNTKSKVLVIVGEKEIGIMKKSAKKIHEAVSGSKLYIAPKMKHGEISLVYSQKYVDLIKSYFKK